MWCIEELFVAKLIISFNQNEINVLFEYFSLKATIHTPKYLKKRLKFLVFRKFEIIPNNYVLQKVVNSEIIPTKDVFDRMVLVILI